MNLMSYIQVSKLSGLRHKNGKAFYDAFDGVYGLFDVEIIQLQRYALSIQNSETENNEVSRNQYPRLQNTFVAETSGGAIIYPIHSNPPSRNTLTRSGFKPLFDHTPLLFSRSGRYYSTKSISAQVHHIPEQPPCFQEVL